MWQCQQLAVAVVVVAVVVVAVVVVAVVVVVVVVAVDIDQMTESGAQMQPQCLLLFSALPEDYEGPLAAGVGWQRNPQLFFPVQSPQHLQL